MSRFSCLLQVLLVLIVSGCAPLWLSNRSEVEEKAFNRSNAPLIEAQTKVDYSRLYAKPVVQKIKVPAMVRGGLYIPEHYEYVVVKPGEYVLQGHDASEQKAESSHQDYRRSEPKPNAERLHASSGTSDIDISEGKKIYGVPERIVPMSIAEGAGDLMLIPYDIGVKDIVQLVSVVHLDKIKEQLTEESLVTPVIMSNDQSIDLGRYSYMISCSTTGVAVTQHMNGKTFSIRVPDGKGFITQDGYIVRPACFKGRA